MLWRLSPSVRSLYALNCRRFNSTAAKAKTKTADPLRILFCGSDKFSSASLRRLAQAKNEDPSLIESIDVVHRPGKPAGSSQKRIKEVPIKQVATEELQLPTHILDTFTGWTPPISYNLIVVVSFGLKVPPRIINLAKYQGINVHPSLLPDLSGPAPIPHTILKHRPFAGITVQTLHPEKFDGGIIVAQTPRPGIKYDKEADLRELTELLSEKGADMLIDVLKSRAFVPPVEDVGWYANSGRPIAHADKIEKQDAFIDFSKNTLDEIMSIHRSGSFPWTKLPPVVERKKKRKVKLSQAAAADSSERFLMDLIHPTTLITTETVPPGIWCPDLSHPFVNHKGIYKRHLMAKTADGGILRIQNGTVSGGKTHGGYERFRRLYGKKHVYVWEKDQKMPTFGKKGNIVPK